MAIITNIEYYRDDRYLDMLKYTWWSGNTVESARTFWNKTTRDACNEIWRLMYQIVLYYAAGKLTCSRPETFYEELIYPQIKDMYEFYCMENWFKERYGNMPSQMFFSQMFFSETPIETPPIIETQTPPIRKSYLEKYFHYPRHRVRTYRDGVDVTDEVEDEVMANDDDKVDTIVIPKGYTINAIYHAGTNTCIAWKNNKCLSWAYGTSYIETREAKRDVYESELRKIFNDYTTPTENLADKYCQTEYNNILLANNI